MKHFSDLQHIPSEHYETTRRKITSGVTDLWFYLRAELGHVLRGLEVLDREEKEGNRSQEAGDRPWEEGNRPLEEGEQQLEEKMDRPQDRSPERMPPVEVRNMSPVMAGYPMRKPLQRSSDYGVKEMVSNLRRVLGEGADRQRYCHLEGYLS